MASPPRKSYDRAVAHGSLMSALTTAGKALHAVLILVLTWLFGAKMVGPFLLGFFLVEIGSSAVTNAWVDATTIFASYHSEDDDGDGGHARRRTLGRVVATALSWSVGLSLIIVVFTELFARPLIDRVFPDYHDLLPGVYLLAWSLVPASFSEVAVGALRAQLRMEWDAWINGLVKPVGLMVFCIAVWALHGGLTGLFSAFLVVQSVAALIVVFPLHRYYGLGTILASVGRRDFDKRLLGFAVPQSLNLMFGRYLTRIDALMLAAFSVGARDVAWYGTVALLVGNLQQIRILFSTALAPVAARHHASGARSELSSLLSRACRWVATLAFPVALVFVVMRTDILSLFSSYYAKNAAFVVVLIAAPLVGTAYGLPGNLIIYAGHSRWALFNSFVVGIANTVLNYLWIPHWGMLGAAFATLVAGSSVTGLQALELHLLEHVHIRWRDIWQPHLGMLLGLVVLAAIWDPANLPSPWQRLGLSIALAAGFYVVQTVVGNPEVRVALRRVTHLRRA